MTMQDDLAAVRALMDKATPGEWQTASRCDYSTHWQVADCGGPSDHLDGKVKVIAEQMDYCMAAEDDAAYIVALHNLFRAHAGEIAAMAAERDRYKKGLQDIVQHMTIVVPSSQGMSGVCGIARAALACGPGVWDTLPRGGG